MGFLSKLQTILQSNRVDLTERFELLRRAISGTMSSTSWASVGWIGSAKVAATDLSRSATQWEGLWRPHSSFAALARLSTCTPSNRCQRLFSIALTIPDTAAILEAVNMLEESEDLIQKPAT